MLKRFAAAWTHNADTHVRTSTGIDNVRTDEYASALPSRRGIILAVNDHGLTANRYFSNVFMPIK